MIVQTNPHNNNGYPMLHWFQKQLISHTTADWIDECAHWVIQQFGEQAFKQHTQLVLPNAAFFPEPMAGPEPMARYILGRVTTLAGVDHWPWQLVDMRLATPAAPTLLGVDSQQRYVASDSQLATTDSLQVPFVIDQISKPQDLVASTAHTCAQHMLWQSQQTPPGGMETFEQAAEVLAIFSGFGIMMTNSAYTYRGGCGRCYNPRANRQASLTESESVYALALFCYLRKEPTEGVFKYLKPHLKSSFKVALKQIKRRPQRETAWGAIGVDHSSSGSSSASAGNG